MNMCSEFMILINQGGDQAELTANSENLKNRLTDRSGILK